MHDAGDLSVLIFLATLMGTFAVSFLGGADAHKLNSNALADQKLSKWLVGLSAGATGNSAFIVTGVVGLGYTLGVPALLLPFGWLFGDIAFWSFFPDKINRVGRETRAATLTDVIASGLPATTRRYIKLLAGALILLCLTGYISAQWIAGQKFLEGAFGFSHVLSLILFAALIVLYTGIGGFRGSVYADTLQALIRIFGTSLALVAVIFVATHHPQTFWQNTAQAGPAFLHLLPHGLLAALVFMLGFAASAFGFGLGQPQMTSRYLAGRTPSETRGAWWIFIGFIQFTWISMTIFGIALRGIMPAIHDPEAGLSLFFRTNMGPILTGLIVADIFATIAATSNSLLVAMAQTMKFDIIEMLTSRTPPLWTIVLLLGIVSMAISAKLDSSVVSLVLSSISLLGAALAPAMMVRVLSWRRTGASVIAAILAGFATAALWKFLGFGAVLNEAAPGILAGLGANFLAATAQRRADTVIAE
jgi:sodium/proline symporter